MIKTNKKFFKQIGLEQYEIELKKKKVRIEDIIEIKEYLNDFQFVKLIEMVQNMNDKYNEDYLTDSERVKLNDDIQRKITLCKQLKNDRIQDDDNNIIQKIKSTPDIQLKKFLTSNYLYYQDAEEHDKAKYLQLLRKTLQIPTNTINMEQLIQDYYNMYADTIKHKSQTPQIQKKISKKGMNTYKYKKKQQQITQYQIQEKTQQKKFFLKDIQQRLDNSAQLMQTIKTKLLSMLNMRINGEIHQPVLTLNGPPGTGKTFILKTFSELLGIPFKIINLGNITSSSTLIGHDFTYISSQEGVIISSILEQGVLNGIILLDEIDKVSEQLQPILLNLLDSTQNNKIQYPYFYPYSFDLSNVWFFATSNYKDNIDKPLQSRLYIINIEDYSFQQKKNIVNQLYIPKINVLHPQIVLSDEALFSVIDEYRQQTGLREIKTEIQNIFQTIQFIIDTSLPQNQSTLISEFDDDQIIDTKMLWDVFGVLKQDLQQVAKSLQIQNNMKQIIITRDTVNLLVTKQKRPPMNMYI